MALGGGCTGWPPLLPGPDLGMGLPPLGGAPDGSIFLRSSLKGSSFFDLSLFLSLPCGGRSRTAPRSLRG